MSKEDKRLIKYYLDTDLIPKGKDGRFFINKNGLEFIIRKECNQECKYCYIVQHGNELYPDKISRKDILKNLDIFLEYCICERKSYFYEMELFAGDLFYDDMYFDIIDIISKYLDIVKREEPEVLKYRLTKIMMPSNLYFVGIDKTGKLADRLVALTDEMYEKYGSWETVMSKALSPNSGMDACLGLYDSFYQIYVSLGQIK